MEGMFRLPFGNIGFYNGSDAQLVVDDLFIPNGLALSKDKKWVDRDCLLSEVNAIWFWFHFDLAADNSREVLYFTAVLSSYFCLTSDLPDHKAVPRQSISEIGSWINREKNWLTHFAHPSPIFCIYKGEKCEIWLQHFWPYSLLYRPYFEMQKRIWNIKERLERRRWICAKPKFGLIRPTYVWELLAACDAVKTRRKHFGRLVGHRMPRNEIKDSKRRPNWKLRYFSILGLLLARFQDNDEITARHWLDTR